MKVQDILDALSTSEIVQELMVLVLVEDPGKPGIARQSIFERRICLYITEAFGKGFRSYSYHIQKDGKMVRRWDNAPHWPEMKTFPHHFHMNSEKEALECQEFFALDVLREIKVIIKREGC